MKSNIIGLDTAKNVFHLYMVREDGEVFKKMLRRKQVLAFFANCPSSLIGIEVCGSSHGWEGDLSALGHEVRLLNARHVKAFVKRNKNVFNDAEAIFDTVSRPNTRTIAIKIVAQHDIHRRLKHCAIKVSVRHFIVRWFFGVLCRFIHGDRSIPG